MKAIYNEPHLAEDLLSATIPFPRTRTIFGKHTLWVPFFVPGRPHIGTTDDAFISCYASHPQSDLCFLTWLKLKRYSVCASACRIKRKSETFCSLLHSANCCVPLDVSEILPAFGPFVHRACPHPEGNVTKVTLCFTTCTRTPEWCHFHASPLPFEGDAREVRHPGPKGRDS